MGKKTKTDPSRFHFTLFKRSTQDGTVLIYARLLETSTGRILAQRPTGTDDERLAAAKAEQLLVELPLAKLAQLKSARDQEGFEAAERLRNMDLASFFVWFWTPSVSEYLWIRIDAEKPFSNYYVLCQSRSVAREVTMVSAVTTKVKVNYSRIPHCALVLVILPTNLCSVPGSVNGKPPEVRLNSAKACRALRGRIK